MLRNGLSWLCGGGLALTLFWLLALLVMPPSADHQKPEQMTLAITQAAPPPPAPAQTKPQTVAQTPPPAPAPAPVASSAIALPDATLPDVPAETVALDSRLPELTEAKPEPRPQPEPQPQPEPEPGPSPAPAAQAAAATPSTDRQARPSPEPSPASNEPVDVGQVAPTRRVSPQYPSRAQRRGMEGFVEMRFVIRRDGRVEKDSIRVIQAKPRRVFEPAARKAIAQWQFEPGSQRRRATQRIRFQLR
ncbi:hypothetical protein GCM10022228_14870 [Halomonas cibimaris]|uniref:Protein TonB n=1 Tax=Halomonas cibimaris TaxID=657012 RepID=A0ABP7LSZ1_9GAMM